MADNAAFGKSKSYGLKPLEMTQGGTRGGGSYDSAEDASNAGSGPTGSSRSYPKGGSKPGDSQAAPFNPQKQEATDIYVGGVP